MREIRRDIFRAVGKADALCVTTNGGIRRDGLAVMGRGVALRAKNLFPGIDRTLAELITRNGNIVQPLLETSGTTILAFPVKPAFSVANRDLSNVVTHLRHQFRPGDRIPGFASIAWPSIVAESARQLQALADQRQWRLVALPPVGSGNGQLEWSSVRPLLAEHLDDRFVVCHL